MMTKEKKNNIKPQSQICNHIKNPYEWEFLA